MWLVKWDIDRVATLWPWARESPALLFDSFHEPALRRRKGGVVLG